MTLRKKQLNFETIDELFTYSNGELFWKNDRGTRKLKGQSAGCIDKKGYCIINIGGIKYPRHTLIWNYHNGIINDLSLDIDHIKPIAEGGKDNIENLRLCSRSGNRLNTTSRNTLGLTNIYYKQSQGSKPWVVRLKQHSICKTFSNVKDAVSYRNQIRKQLNMTEAKDRNPVESL